MADDLLCYLGRITTVEVIMASADKLYLSAVCRNPHVLPGYIILGKRFYSLIHYGILDLYRGDGMSDFDKSEYWFESAE